MKNLSKNFLIVLTVFLMLAFFFALYTEQHNQTKEISLNKLTEEINSNNIKKIEVSGDDIYLYLNNNKKEVIKKEPQDSFLTMLKSLGITSEKIEKLNIEVKQKTDTTIISNILFIVLPFILIAFFIYFMMRQVQGMNRKAMMFGQSRAREAKNTKNKVTFKNVAGAKEAKEELLEVVDFLKSPQKFLKMGAKIPKGVLLLGPPGVGKTLLARAVAGEADVPFFHISGSEFVEMFVGVGAARVRDLFQKAKKQAPAILFIDEIDAVGRRRGAGLGGSHDEREQTLNQILVEMDGFDSNTNIIVIAATNRPDVLDPALLRPGRFDRRVVLDLPDINDRDAILNVHALHKPLSKDVSLREVAERTPGFSGADLENLLNEAAILSVRRNKKVIEKKELLESIEKVLLGPERKSYILSKEEKKITAYHEAGHALVAKILPHSDPVHKISIVSRGRAAGYTLKVPSFDRKLNSRSKFLDELAVLLAGYTSEKIFFKEVTTGATNDLREATKIAHRLVTELGMAENLPPRTFGEREDLIFLGKEIHEQRDYSEKIAEKIDEEVNNFIIQAQKKAEKTIIENKDKIEIIVKKLLKKETIEREEFEKIFKDN